MGRKRGKQTYQKNAHKRQHSPAAPKQPAQPPFRRVVIQGTLTLQSELHLGSGMVSEAEGSDASYNLIQRDTQGVPFLPGSSLRGLLAAQLDSQGYPAVYRRLFGLSRQAVEEAATLPQADPGGSGLLRVYDAPARDKVSLSCRSRTRIEPVTGTAYQHHLASHELVPAGTEFQLRFVLEHSGDVSTAITEGELGCLLTLLQALNQQQLGAGKSIGQGKINWANQTIQVITETDFRSWLLSNLQRKANAASKVHVKPLNDYLKAFTPGDVSDGLAKPVGWEYQAFLLKPQGPVLINHPEAIRKNSDNDPDVTFMTRLHDSKQQAVIPGSTLKGWFRAQSRRILLTLTQGEQVQRVEGLVGEIFGSAEHGIGCLWFEDAFVEFNERSDQHRQMFNAVDRFTGGVKDSALFCANALWTQESFQGGIRYYPERLQGWMMLLLLYVWQDAKDGDLVLGWGKSKGYGRLILTVMDDDNPGWLEKPDTTEFVQWQNTLYNKLGLNIAEAV